MRSRKQDALDDAEADPAASGARQPEASLRHLITQALRAYWTREELRHRLPRGADLAGTWAEVERARETLAIALPLLDERGRPFTIALAPPLLEAAHHVDRLGSDSMFRSNDPDAKRRLVVQSLVEEACASSRIEGAITTLAKAKQLVSGEREPRSKSDRMVLNNYRAMQWILEWRSRPLDLAGLLELHRLMSQGAYEGPQGTEGTLRADDTVRVVDLATAEIVHVPPPAAQLAALLEGLLTYAGTTPEGPGFVHPLLRASAIHFYLAYLHPFYDGNGRTARALFYHHMLRAGYDSFQYLSISTVIDQRRAQYYRAFRDVESSAQDLTYFALFSCKATELAVEGLRQRALKDLGVVRVLDRLRERRAPLNDRQERWLRTLLAAPQRAFAIDAVQARFRVSYPTARQDVLDLLDKRVLKTAFRKGKKQFYVLDDALLLS